MAGSARAAKTAAVIFYMLNSLVRSRRTDSLANAGLSSYEALFFNKNQFLVKAFSTLIGKAW